MPLLLPLSPPGPMPGTMNCSLPICNNTVSRIWGKPDAPVSMLVIISLNSHNASMRYSLTPPIRELMLVRFSSLLSANSETRFWSSEICRQSLRSQVLCCPARTAYEPPLSPPYSRHWVSAMCPVSVAPDGLKIIHIMLLQAPTTNQSDQSGLVT